MGAAAELRKQIESALAGRIPAALSPRPLRSPELVSCGVAEVDSLLGGGLPLGAIVELTGSGSSGRTTLALSTLAGLTRRGHCCAYVDACDALDPLSAAALGVELPRLLWVRPPERHSTSLKSKESQKPKAPHFCPPLAEVGSKAEVGSASSAPRAGSYQRLDRALRATDLLLNAGGWSAVVLDLGELPPAQARRVPLATWYRFRLQAEKSRALLLLLTPIACAHSGAPSEPSVGLLGLSCAAVSLRFKEAEADWRRAAAGVPDAPSFGVLERESGPALLAGLRYRVELVRSRSWVAGASSRAADSVPAGSIPKKPAASEGTRWSGALMWPG